MRLLFFIAVALCFSACFAEGFLGRAMTGAKNKIDLKNLPFGFLSALEYVRDGCSNDELTIDNVKEASAQLVNGTNYEIEFKNNQIVKVYQSLPDQKNDKVQYIINQCQ